MLAARHLSARVTEDLATWLRGDCSWSCMRADQPELPDNVHVGKRIADAYHVLSDIISTDDDAEELDRILGDVHVRVRTENGQAYSRL